MTSAAEMARQEAGAARDVERPRRRKRREPPSERRRAPRPSPARRAARNRPAPTPPVVVLGRPRVVVGLHAPRVRRVLPLESVPNFSEGRDRATIDALGRRSARRHGCSTSTPTRPPPLGLHARRLARTSSSTRCSPGSRCARERIDLRRHDGAHPRIGAADVVPVVPLRPSDLERAGDARATLAPRIAAELGLPVFLYGESAPGRGPAFFRRGGPAGAPAADRRGRARGPTSGRRGSTERRAASSSAPGGRSSRSTWTSRGATSRSRARSPRSCARAAAAFPGVRALGLDLPRAGLVQVSMNVEDYEAARAARDRRAGRARRRARAAPRSRARSSSA